MQNIITVELVGNKILIDVEDFIKLGEFVIDLESIEGNKVNIQY